MGLPGISGKLSRAICDGSALDIKTNIRLRTSDDPEINVKSSSIQVNCHDIGLVQLEVFVRIRGLDGVAAGSIAEHAIAGHLNVEDMLLAVSIAIRKYPFGALTTTRQAVYGIAILSPDKALIVGVPMELDMVLVAELIGHGQVDAEPMSRPTGTEPLADSCWAEVVPRSFLEGGTGEVWRRVNIQLDVITAGSAAFGDLAIQASICTSQAMSGDRCNWGLTAEVLGTRTDRQK